MKIQLPAEYEFLNFDRFDVHVKGKSLTETQIEQVKAVIASTTDLALKSVLSKQLGIYYGFHLRSAKQASEYCRIWQSTIDDQTSEAYAEACNYLGFSESIDGGYRDPALFETALAIYQELEKTATEANDLQEVKLNQAFAMRYIGVTTRRQGIQLDKAGDVTGAGAIFERAFQILSDVVEIQQANHANPIDLAESFHLLGVFYQSRKRIPEAEASLQQALIAWKDVVRTTGPHPIKFVTMQSLGNIQMHQKKTTDAIELLQQTRAEQEIYFGTKMQEDIAKTMHFLGEAFEANGEPLNALAAYVEALKIKQTLKLSEGIIQPTRLAIEKLQETLTPSITEMNHEFQFDWNDAQSIENTRIIIGKAQQLIKNFEYIANTLPEATAYQWAQLLYKVATFYLHVKYDEVPKRLDIALNYLTQVKPILKGVDYYWALNQQACGYQQKMMRKDFSFSDKLHAVNGEVIFYNELPKASLDSHLLAAFAYCTSAQGMSARGDIKAAVHTYRKALNIYEAVGEEKSNQYLRAKNVYATYLTQAGQLELAATTYHELHDSWQSKPNYHTNLFAGRFYVSYAKFLRDNRPNSHEALKQFERAQAILTAAGAHEFSREIEQETQPLREVCARVQARENAGSPHFHRSGSPSYQQPMHNASSQTATNTLT